MPDDHRRSLRALDFLNFCNSGIQTGLGPFIALFYAAVRHWNPTQIGIALSCQSLAGILIQPAAGHWIDESRHKRAITAAAGLIVSASAALIAVLPSYPLQIAVQLVIGIAVTIFPAAISSFALGLVPKEAIPARVARNESLTHAGNLLFAVVAGAVGTFVSLKGIFFCAALFASGMAFAALLVRQGDISFEAARASEETNDKKKGKPAAITQLFNDKRVLIFALVIVLFYCANAATLPLVGQILNGAGNHGRRSAWQISAAIMVAEGVMIGVAAYSGQWANRFGRKPLFVVSFAVLALRNGLTVANHNRFYLIGLQALDGIAAAIYGVLLTLITADLAQGTGRFNFLRSTVQSAMGLGGFLSNAAFGWVAKSCGFNAAFWGLAAVAISGGVVYQSRMPETRPEENRPDAAVASAVK